MKRITSIILAMLLALSCIACGSEDYKGGQVTGLNQEENVDETSEDTVEKAVEEVAEENVEEAEEEVADEGKELSLGRLQGGVYTNEYFGGACELDSSWTFYSAEELQELPETVSEMMSETELGDSLSDLSHIVDMKAENETDLTVINIGYQKLSAQERLAALGMNEKELVDLTLAEADLLKETYAQMGITVEEISAKTVTFMGEERTAVYTKAKVQEMDYYILQLFDYHLGEYAVTITFNSYIEDKTESLLDLFYAI